MNIQYFKPEKGFVTDNYFNLKNYDISSFCNGHLAYRSKLGLII